MYPISDTLKQLFLNGNKKCCKLTLNNATTVDCVITEADILSDSLTIDRYCSSGNKIEVGSAIAAELTLTLLNNDDKFNHITFEGSEVSLEIGIEGVSDSYIPCGKFTIDEPPRSLQHIKLRALDFMMLFDKKVDANDIQEIDTVEGLLVKCCEVCSVELWDKDAIKSLPNYDQTIKVPTADITYRQIIQWIAQITGTCAFMDWEGKLRLSWFKDSGVVLDPTNRYIGGTLDENNITIKGVCIKTQNTVVTTEDSVNPVVIESNQLLYSDDEKYLKAIAKNIAKGLGTLTYRPFQCNTIPMPFLYPLDIVGYEGAAEGDFSTVITNHNFGLNKASALSAVGETATQSGYSSVKGLTKAEIDSAIREAMNGIDAKAEHIHIRYSAYEKGLDASGNASMSDKPDATTEYLGTCADNNATAPDTPSSYKWVKIRGVDAYTVMLSNESHTFAGTTTAAIYGDAFVYIEAYKGATRIPTKITKVNGTEVSGKQTALVEPYVGLFVQCFNNDGEATNNYADMTATENLTTQSGVITLTIEADGQTFTKDFSFSVARKGSDGGTLQVKYKSSSTVPTIFNNNVGDWKDAIPTPSAGQRVYMTQKLSTETNWSTPIQISAEDGTTPTVSINSNGYWVINGGTTTVKARGTNGRTPTITVGENGNWFVDNVDTGEKAQGEQGKDGADIEYIYYRKTASGTPTTPTASTTISAPSASINNTWTSSPCGITETYKYEYVSVRTKAAGSSTWGAFSAPVIWSKWGEKGTDGDGVEYKYFISDSAGKYEYTAGDLTWTDEPTGVDKDFMYEYVVQITHHGDGTTTISDAALWAKWGEKGDTGKDGQNLYAECQTDASEFNKDAILKTGSLSSIKTGCTITVKFVNKNTHKTPYLRVYNANSSSDITHYKSDGSAVSNCPIIWNKVSPSTNNPLYWGAGTVVTMVFDGASWVIIDVGATKMDMTSSGLTIGNYSSSGALVNNVLIGTSDISVRNNTTVYASFGASSATIGQTGSGYRNIYIDSSSVNIRNGSTVLSSFGASSATIGQTSGTNTNVYIDSDSVDIRRGTTTLAGMTYRSDTTYGDTFTIKGPNMLDITSANVVRLVTDYSNNSDSANAYLTVHSNGGHGVFSALTTKVKDSKTYQSSLALTSESAELFAYSYIDNAAKESKVEVKPEAITLDTNYIYLNGESRIKNNIGIACYDSLGTTRMALKCGTGDYLDIGSGFTKNAAKGTVIYGKTLQFYVSPKGTTIGYTPYYSNKVTTTITDKVANTTYGTTTTANISIMTTGFLTDGTKKVIYTVPLAKPVIGNPTVGGTTIDGYYLRQNNKYTHGSAWNTSRVTPNKTTAYLSACGNFVYIEAEFNADSNATNNSPIAIEAKIQVSFS